MALNLADCQFHGPALPEPFVKFELERELTSLKLLPKATGAEGKGLAEAWQVYRRKLRSLAASGGELRVLHHVIEPLKELLGYKGEIQSAPQVQTREDLEDGGHLLTTSVNASDSGATLRVWTTPFDEDLYAPSQRGRAYRFSHLRIAQRVLLATGERLGLATNGVQLVLLVSDPARPDSTVTIPLDPDWRTSRDVPDSFRFLLAVARPEGVKALPKIVDKARLQQARVTKELRRQAREAVEGFIQEILIHPGNRPWLARQTDRQALARQLWREGLITVYRLLFILKLESSDDVARSFSFASTSLWRNSFSPSMALARYAAQVRDHGAETGQLLERGLRTLYQMFEQGLESTELVVKPLGGALFGKHATPILDALAWGEQAVACLLDKLLWTPPRRGSETRERVHYGPLDVEDLGRVYEALLELEPGITTEPMCRLRRQKLEVVVPIAQGERYRPAEEESDAGDQEPEDADADEADEDEEESTGRGKKTKVEWIEAIPPGKFYLRVGLGRKASGSYYTPHSFVRFLVQETLGPQVAERSPPENPQPLKILELNVLDPAMGSGHFLVEACRYLGDKLYEACRLCDEQALAADRRAESAKKKEEREQAENEARALRQRVIDLPDPDDELLKYLPSRSPEGGETGLSQSRAIALCRRLVATHCLYGVDKNPLAVELAKLALWLESHAEGMPLTFLDHRLVVGDSLTGPFWERLLTRPGKPDEKLEGVIFRGLETNLRAALFDALKHIQRLEASVGATVAEIHEKELAKRELDESLIPFRVAAAAWAGGVMLGSDKCDDAAYAELLTTIATTRELPKQIDSPALCAMIAHGLGLPASGGREPTEALGGQDGEATVRDGEASAGPLPREQLTAVIQSSRCIPALSYDLAFPEVFYPTGVVHGRQGFHAVVGNPPWDRVRPAKLEFLANFSFEILDAPTASETKTIENTLLADEGISSLYEEYAGLFTAQGAVHDALYAWHEVKIGEIVAGRGNSDLYIVFLERSAELLQNGANVGLLVPSGFHANEGCTGVRQLYINKMRLKSCYSFENRRRLFDIHRSTKFALVVATRGGHTEEFLVGFYLHDDEWLFREGREGNRLRYTAAFIRHTGGDLLTFLELRSERDLAIAETLASNGVKFGHACEAMHVRLGRECDMNRDSSRFTSTNEVLSADDDPRTPSVCAGLIRAGYLLLHDDKTYDILSDLSRKWRPRYLVSRDAVVNRDEWLSCARYFRFSFRDITGATNTRTCIIHLLPPGSLFGHTTCCEKQPEMRPNATALWVTGVLSTFPFDWTIRIRALTHVSLYIINSCPFPDISSSVPFVTHNVIRLVSNHAGYEPLWREQLGDLWREAETKEPFTWPVLAGDDERWAIRAAVDAIVADAYGLSRDQYAHVLSTFSHTSYPQAPERCLAAFDELKQIGLGAFTKKHDPYHDIPLNQSLPQPVIELPLPADPAGQDGSGFQLTGSSKRRKSQSANPNRTTL